MAEITELKKHIINYAKTKDVFTAYRQSGFSSKFYESNVESILLHQSAKQVLGLANPEKILTFKSLQLEYQTYQLRKKSILANYKIEKLQMRKFLNTKNNLDYIFNIGEAKKARNDRSILNIGDDSLIN